MQGTKLKELTDFDNAILKLYSKYCLVGIDEVGRGAIAGPVIACAFSWKDRFILNNKMPRCLSFLNDSKKLSKKQRKYICKSLIKYGEYGIGYASVLEIEKLNILNATFLAMKRAYENLLIKLKLKNSNVYILIDGNKFNPYINSRQLPIIGGDSRSSLIAGASVIAKVYRDLLMKKISKLKRFKKYKWSKNVGYGTRFHFSSIRKYGLTPFHRKLFVRKAYCFK